jgi:molecular chaperone GrpE
MNDSDADLPVAAPDAATGEEPADTHGEAPVLTPTPAELGIELPDEPTEAMNELLRLLADARHDAAAERDTALRALAEMENLRKRTVRDMAETRQRATEGLVRQLLAVLDSFDAGMAIDADEADAAALKEGFTATRDQLLGSLSSIGLEAVPGIGAPFDPQVHEAVSVLDQADQLVVVHEMRKGYTLGGLTLRPAAVVVGPAPDGDTEAS